MLCLLKKQAQRKAEKGNTEGSREGVNCLTRRAKVTPLESQNSKMWRRCWSGARGHAPVWRERTKTEGTVRAQSHELGWLQWEWRKRKLNKGVVGKGSRPASQHPTGTVLALSESELERHFMLLSKEKRRGERGREREREPNLCCWGIVWLFSWGGTKGIKDRRQIWRQLQSPEIRLVAERVFWLWQ